MTRVWLINPPMQPHEMFARGSQATASINPPLGLGYIASYLKRHGHPCEILDGAVTPILLEEVVRRSHEFDFLGITVASAYYLRVIELLELLKKAPSRPPIIVGGPHVTAMPESVLDDGADIAVVGEGEETMLELARLYENDTEHWRDRLPEVRGIVFKDDNGIVQRTPPRPPIFDLDRIPLPARDMLPMRLYGGSVARSSATPSHTLLTSRGCPGCCTFCNHRTFGNNLRYFSTDRVIEEFFQLRDQYGANAIQVMDDNFVSNHDFVHEVCKRLTNEKFDKPFSVEARADSVNPAVLKMLKQAGCDYIAFGVESGAQRILDFVQKRETLDQIRQAIAWAKEARLSIRGYFILGFPTETMAEMKETLRFAKELNIEVASFTLLVPFPGTVDWVRAQQSGTFDPWFFRKQILPEFNFPDQPFYVPAGMTAQELLKFHRYAYNSYYFRPRFLLKRLFAVRKMSELWVLAKGAYTLVANCFITKEVKG